MKEKLTVIKVGGAVVEQPEFLDELLRNFAAVPGHKILVHGGGRSATRIASQLGIETTMVAGRRITDAEMLDVVTMVYGGLVNKNLVARLQARGVNALGLTGADMNTILSHRRPPKQVTTDDGTTQNVDYGFVGDVDRVDAQQLAYIINNGIVPVVAPLTHDGQGHMLNTNADTMASAVAVAMSSLFDVTLTFAFEKMGVLLDPDDDDSVIPTITPSQYTSLKQSGAISGGMVPKLDNAFQAIDSGVSQVVITSATCIDGSCGTTLKRD